MRRVRWPGVSAVFQGFLSVQNPLWDVPVVARDPDVENIRSCELDSLPCTIVLPVRFPAMFHSSGALIRIDCRYFSADGRTLEACELSSFFAAQQSSAVRKALALSIFHHKQASSTCFEP